MFPTHGVAGPLVAFRAGARSTPRAARLPAVDHFRGFAVLMMAVMNHLLGVETLPAWLQHTPDVGLTVTDLGAPWFIFAIGLTYRRKLYASALAVACAGGLALNAWVPISKARVSASYVSVSLAVSAALYALFYVLTEKAGWRSAGLTAWGRNPLVLYLLLNVLLALLVLPDIPTWHARAPFWLAAGQAFVLVATLNRVALWLSRRGAYISL